MNTTTKKTLLAAGTFASTLVLAVTFQNCAQPISGDSGTTAQASSRAASIPATPIPGGGTVPTPYPVSTPVPNLLTPSLLSGSWTSACHLLSGVDYYTTAKVFSGGQAQTIQNYFESPTCAGSPYATVQISATYVIRGLDATYPKITDADFTVTLHTVTPKNTSEATYLNSLNFCSMNTWQANVAVVIPTTNSCYAQGKPTYRSLLAVVPKTGGSALTENDASTGAPLDAYSTYSKN